MEITAVRDGSFGRHLTSHFYAGFVPISTAPATLAGANLLRFNKSNRLPLKYNLSAPSSFEKFRSNVPNGRWPAFRAVSRIKQSENPSLGQLRYCSSAAATLSDSWRVESLLCKSISLAVDIFSVSQFVQSHKNPRRFDKNQRAHLCPFTHEGFRRSNLPPVVARDQTNQECYYQRRACFFLHVAPYALIELFYLLRDGRAVGKDRSVNIL
jgi:hypothetical protein